MRPRPPPVAPSPSKDDAFERREARTWSVVFSLHMYTYAFLCGRMYVRMYAYA